MSKTLGRCELTLQLSDFSASGMLGGHPIYEASLEHNRHGFYYPVGSYSAMDENAINLGIPSINFSR